MLARERQARVRAERATDRTARLQRLAAALSRAGTGQEVADVIIVEGLPALDANVGAVVRLSDDGATFHLLRVAGYPEDVARAWQSFPAQTPLHVSDAVRERQPVVLETLEERNARYPLLAKLHAPGGNGAAVALPLLISGRAIGAIGLSFPSARRFNANERVFMQALADLCAQALERARLSDAVRASEERLHTVVQNAPLILFALDQEGRFTLSEGRVLERLGQQPGQAVGASAFAVHRERPEIVRAIQAALSGEAMTSIGAVQGVTFETRWMPLDNGAGAPAGAIGVAVDVTERVRAEEALRRKTRALTTLSACNHALVRAATESDLLRGICQAIVEVGSYRLAWVGYAEHDAEKTIRPVAQCGDDSYLADLRVSWAETPQGRGPAGTAVRTGRPCAVQNMQTAPIFVPWRAAALAHGYAATLALPLVVSGRVIGLLAIYAAESEAFDAEETDLLAQLAGDLAYGIAALRGHAERMRADDALRASEDRYRRIVESAEEGIWETDADGRTTYVNQKMAGLLGYTPAEMQGTSFLTYIHPDERAAARTWLERRRQNGPVTQRSEARLSHRNGTTLWVLLAVAALTDAEGQYAGAVALVTDLTERRQAEEANIRLAAIVEFSYDAITGRTLDGTVVSWNAGAERLYGYTAQEIMDQPVSVLIPADRAHELDDITERLRRDERIVDLETVRVHQDGHLLDVLLSISPIKDSSGTITGVAAIAHDIGERKRTEQANARLAAIVASTQDAIISNTPDGLITSWNASAERLFGYTADEMLGQSVTRLIPRDDRATFQILKERFQRGERRAAFEAKRLHKDGHAIDVAASVAAITDAAGRVRGVATIAHDISERKRAENALRVRARQQAAVANLGVQALAERDLAAVFDQAVQVVARTLEIEYCQVLELVPEGDALLLRAGVGWREGVVGRARVGIGLESQSGYTLAARGPVVVEDLRAETRFSGSPLLHEHDVVSGMSVVIHGTDGPFGVLGAHTTERRTFTRDDLHFLQAVANVLSAAVERAQAEEVKRRSAELEEQNRRIAEASRLKSDFLANMSHELRTPLNAIMGFTELLHDGKIGPVSADQQEFLGDILTSSRHLLQIINDILDLAKVEAGKTEFRPESVDPARLVAEVCAIVRTLVAHKRLRLVTEIDPALGPLVLDPARLKQVLYNYLSNAIKFSHTGGTITISVTAEDADHLRLAVQDTGIGIGLEDQARLFTEFEQLEIGTAMREQGTGLGLALTRRIVEAQGGRVGVTSAVGAGSTFYAVLPRSAPRQEANKASHVDPIAAHSARVGGRRKAGANPDERAQA